MERHSIFMDWKTRSLQCQCHPKWLTESAHLFQSSNIIFFFKNVSSYLYRISGTPNKWNHPEKKENFGDSHSLITSYKQL